MVVKDSRDTLRRIQRQLRDHYSTRAEELTRSTSRGPKRQRRRPAVRAERAKRLRDLEAELARIETSCGTEPDKVGTSGRAGRR